MRSIQRIGFWAFIGRAVAATIVAALMVPGAARAASLNWDVGAGGVPASGNWDTSTANWSAAAPTYVPAGTAPNMYTNGGGDTVNFDSTSLANSSVVITLPGGGLTPQAINILSSSASATGTGVSYTFTGGPFIGSGALSVQSTQNTAGTGVSTILTTASPSWTGNLIVGTTTKVGPNLESQVTGAFGTGAITMQGVAGAGGAFLNFSTQTQTVANDITFSGTGVSSQVFSPIGPAGTKVTFTGNITGNDDNLRINRAANGQGRIVEIRPGTGKTVTGTGSTTIQFEGLSISNSNQMLTGNLSMASNGIFIFDNMSYAALGRTPGTGSNQWQITAQGGGFAARGQDVTITSVPTTLLDSNIGIGWGDTSYADHSVKIQSGNTLALTGAHQILTFGAATAQVNANSGVTFAIGTPVNEIADKIDSAGFTLSLGGNANTTGASARGGGLIRFSNPNNSIANLQVGTTAGTSVLVLTNTGAGGGGTINLGTSGLGGGGGFLLFEDTTGTGTTFTNNFNVNVLDTSGNINHNGFGSLAGNTTFTGTATLTTPSTLTVPGSVTASGVPINIIAGTLTLGTNATAATITNNRALNYSANYNGGTYYKNNAGEIVLNNVTYNGTNANGFKWRLIDGTMTTASMGAAGSLGGLLSNTNIIPSDIFSQDADAGRVWRTTTANQSYVTNGGVNPTGDFQFDNQSDLTLDMGASSFFANTAGAQLIRKTGNGTLMLKSTAVLAANGDTSDFFQIEAGTLDVKGNTGNTSFRVQGGTLLSADVSGFVTGRTLEVTAAGGKIGISTNAAADVSRSVAGGINTWTQGGTLTLAARDNKNLIFTTTAFPNLTAGSLMIQRDDSGTLLAQTGVVQINNTALSIGAGATLGGSGTLKLGATGTGTLTINGTIAPGNSPGILTTVGTESWASGGTYQWQINNWTGAQGTNYDFLNITGGLSVAATAGSWPTNQFRIDITGLTAGNAVGAVPNFSNTVGRSWTIAEASTGVAGFAANKFFLDTGNLTGSNSLNNGGFTLSVVNGAGSIQDLVLGFTPAAIYNLSASLAGGSLANGRITSGQTTNATATITNIADASAASLNYTGLNLTPTGNLSGAGLPKNGGPVAPNGGSDSGTRTFTGGAPGSVTLTPGVTTATNQTIGGNANLNSTTTASVLVDALVEHTSLYNDTGLAATASTSAYRKVAAYGGDDLGTVVVTKNANLLYIPGYADNLGGVFKGTLTVQVSGDNNQFPPFPSTFLLDFANVNAGSGAIAALLSIESDLSTYGFNWVDRFGNSGGSSPDPAPMTALRTAPRDYDLELFFSPAPAGTTTYFDFDFTKATYSATGGVNNLAVVPEPASGALIAVGLLLIARRRRA